MSYIDKQYMIGRFSEQDIIELTDRVEPSTDTIVDDVLNLAISGADGMVDSYISARYKTPLNPVPEMIKTCSGSIAYYQLCRDRYTEETHAQYKDALKYLQDISNGKAHLVAQGVEPSSAFAEARVEAPDRVFNRDSLKGF